MGVLLNPTTEILVRECYKTAYDKIMGVDVTKSFPAFSITGNSGIGKSTSVFYFIYRLLHEENPSLCPRLIVYELSKYVVVIENGKVALHAKDDVPPLGRMLVDFNCVYFVDAVSPLLFPNCRIIQLTSTGADTSVSKEFFKKYPVRTLTLPVWKKQEIGFARNLSQFSSSFTDDEIFGLNKGYNLWGGIPRRVFRTGKDISIHEAIAAFNLPDIDRIQPDIRELKYALVHVVANDNLEKTGLKFCSDYAAYQLMERLLTRNKQQVCHFLQVATDPEIATVRGNLFEPFVHNGLSVIGRHTFKTRRLGAGGSSLHHSPPAAASAAAALVVSTTEMVEFNVLSTTTIHSSTPKMLEDSHCKVGTYVMPDVKVFPSIDSFLVLDDQIAFFQITVGLKHGVKAKYLDDLIQLFTYSKMVKPGLPWRLYFVTPPDIFPSFGTQPYLATKGKNAVDLTLFAHVQNVQQFVLEFPLSTSNQ